MRLPLLAAFCAALCASAAAADNEAYQRHLRAYAAATGGDRTTIELLCETYGFKRKPATTGERAALATCVQREVQKIEMREALREAQDRDLMYRSITQPVVPVR